MFRNCRQALITSYAAAPPLGGEDEFPLTINVQDAKGNILKMRLQFGVQTPELLSNHSHD